jgi:hypothetical protein
MTEGAAEALFCSFLKTQPGLIWAGFTRVKGEEKAWGIFSFCRRLLFRRTRENRRVPLVAASGRPSRNKER